MASHRLKLMDLGEALGRIKELIRKDGILILPHAQDKIDDRQIRNLKSIMKTDIKGIEQQIHDDDERYILTYFYDEDKDLKVVIKINVEDIRIITAFPEKRGKR